MSRFAEFESILRILAADFDTQIIYIKNIFHLDNNKNVDELFNVDEIALEFEDVFSIEDDRISLSAKNYINDIHSLLSSQSFNNDDDFWTAKGLEINPAWARLRLLAVSCLQELGLR